MKNLIDQGAWRSAYVNTSKTGNAERADFSCLPAGLGPELTECKARAGARLYALRGRATLQAASSGPNAISLSSINRP